MYLISVSVVIYLLLCWRVVSFSNFSSEDPILSGFTLNCYDISMTLEFDRQIDATTLNISAFQFQGVRNLRLNASNPSFSQYALRVESYYSSLTNLAKQGNKTYTVQVYFGVDIYAQIVSMSKAAKSRANSFISLDRGFVLSSHGYPSRPILHTAAFQATHYVNDTLLPFILNFGVDMNKAQITFIFSEPINVYSINIYGMAAQIKSNSLTSGAYVKLIPTNNTSPLVKASDYNRNVTISMGSSSFNAITANLGLWSAIDTSYFSAYFPFVADVAGNKISTFDIDQVQAKLASFYFPDITPPKLLYWDLNFDVGYLTIVFTETVQVAYFNVSRIALLSSSSYLNANTSILSLANPKSVSTTRSAAVTVYLSDAQITFLKLSNGIGKSQNNSYLALQYGTVIDMSDYQNKYQGTDATLTAARRVHQLQADITRPQLIAASLDMTAQTITITFSEIVLLSSLNPSQISLQSQRILSPTTEALVPAGLTADRATVLTKKNSNRIIFQMTPALFNQFKSFSVLGRSLAGTYIAFTKTLVTDVSLIPNLVFPVSTGLAMSFTSFVPDRIAPRLVSWYFDLNFGQVHLTFSEPMDSLGIKPTEVTLYSDAYLSPAIKQITLSGASTVFSISAASSDIIIQLTADDVNYIKVTSPLCSISSRCFISLTAAFGTDKSTFDSDGTVVANPVIPVSFIASSNQFVRDSTPPSLVRAVYDAGGGILIMTFDEPVVFSTASLLTFSDSAFGSFALTSFSKADGSRSLNITVNLCTQDYVNLKLADPVASSSDNTFLSIGAGAVQDMHGNSIRSLTRKQCYFVPDTLAPSLTAFYFNATNGHVSYYFDDVLEVSQTNPIVILLVGSTGASVDISRGTNLAQSNSNLFVIDVTTIKNIIADNGIGTSQGSTYTYLSAVGAVFDFPNHIPSLKMPPASAIREGNRILAFWLDLDANTLVLEMAAPLTVSRIVASMFNLQSTSTVNVFQFTSFNSSSSLTPYFLQLPISAADSASIVSNLQFANRFQLSLSVSAAGIVDIGGFQLAKTSVAPCSYLNSPTSTSALSFFDLDLSTGILSLHFTHLIVVASLQVSSLHLANGRLANSTSIALTNSMILSTSVADTTVLVSLNAGPYPNDRERIMLQGTGLGATSSSLFLYTDDGYATDVSVPPNYLSTIKKLNSSQVRVLTPDFLPPQLVSFNLDLTRRKLFAFFDEAVNAQSNRPSYYLLLRDPNLPLAEKRFLQTSNTSRYESIGRTIVMNISQTDFDAIMYQAPNLCLVASMCHLSIKAGAVRDVSYSSNNIMDLFFRFGVKVSTFVPNLRPATLSRYDVSMQDGNMDMYFSDVIECAKFNIAKFVFQNLKFIGTQGYTFFLSNTTTFSCSARNVRYIHFTFGLDNVIAMKATLSLLKSAASTFLRIATGGFYDVAGNTNYPVNDGSAIAVTNYVADTVSPNILSYTISQQAVVTLYFDEPINQNSLTVSEISFQDNVPTFVKSYALSVAKLTIVDTYKMQISIALGQDLFRIKTDSTIFLSQTTTYLRCTKFTIYDTAGNPVIPISSTNALIMGPTLKYWDFNMDGKKLYFYYSESVNSSFSPSGMTIQTNSNYSDASTSVLTLTTLKAMTARDAQSTTFVVSLNDYDINTLKLHQIANNSLRSFLTVPFGQTVSKSSGTIVPYLKSIAISKYTAKNVRNFYPDVTPPKCLYFDLNLNSPGKLVIGFDEPVVASSLVLTAITIISKQFGNFVTMKNGLTVSNNNLTELELLIPLASSMNLIKLSYKEGALNGLILGANSAYDYNNNFFPGNFEFSAIPIRSFVPDQIPPTVQYSSFDVGNGLLQITFDEIIVVSSCKPFNIYILSNRTVATSYYVVQLTNFSLITSTDAITVVVNLKLYDLDEFSLLSVPPLYQRRNSTFILVEHVQDLFGNEIVGSGRNVDAFLPDSVAPNIWSFQYVKYSEYIQFYFSFSELMDVDTFNCSDFIFVSTAAASANESKRFGYDSCWRVSKSANKISFSVNESYISGLSLLFSGSTYTFVAAPTTTATDISGNLLTPIPIINALALGTSLVKYFVNLMKGSVTLIFSSDVVLDGSFNVSQVGFFSLVTRDTFHFSSNSTVDMLFDSSGGSNSSIAVIQISAEDFINFKYIEPQQSSLYITFGESVARDTKGFWLLPITMSDAYTAASFVGDTERPQINLITLDMSNDFIRIQFDEPVRSSSVIISNFRLQSNQTSLAKSVKLSGGFIEVDKNVLTIHFAKQDMVAIKLRAGLAKAQNSSFLSFTFNSLTDLFGNYLRAVPFSSASSVSVYIPDTKAPDLEYFDMDFTSNILTLTFSEPVSVLQFNITVVTMQNAFYSGIGAKYTFTGGRVLGFNSDVVAIQLLTTDINNIKLIDNLGTTKQYTYLILTSHLTVDMFNNPNNPIVDGAAMTVNLFTKDSIAPTLVDYTYNADKFYLLLNMSEPVLMTSVRATGLTLSMAVNSNVNYTLSRFSLPNSLKLSFTLRLNLSPLDVNSIKLLAPLASSRDTTWISFDSTLVQDVFENPIVHVLATNARQAAVYVPDTTPPAIITYTLDMNAMTIVLVVTESISLKTLHLDQLNVQSCAIRRFCENQTMALATASFVIGISTATMTIAIPTSTEFAMKFNRIGIDVRRSLLSWTDTFAYDFARNFMLPLWDGSVDGFVPRQPDVFLADTTRPRLINWYLDRRKRTVHLRFSEPVVELDARKIIMTADVTVNSHQIAHAMAFGNVSFQRTTRNFDSELEYFFPPCHTADCLANHTDFLDQFAQSPLTVHILDNAFGDFAAISNLNLESGHLNEGKTVCGQCGKGTYASKNCTSSDDEVCSVCSACPVGMYQYAACNLYQDTLCAECSTCSVGNYISSACSANTDTICSQCTSCNNLQYASQECANGLNTICTSCQSCFFKDAAVRKLCDNDRYRWWAQASCCFAEDGTQTMCNAVDRQNMLILTRDGRHHWAFPKTTPEVVGTKYALGKTW